MRPSSICWNIVTVDVPRASWITVVLACLIAALLFAVNGYTGYAITVATVGLAAAVNLA